jgi:hypothetical protein
MLVILMVALANFAAGSIMGPGSSEKEKARGFLGYDCRNYTELSPKKIFLFMIILYLI